MQDTVQGHFRSFWGSFWVGLWNYRLSECGDSRTVTLHWRVPGGWLSERAPNFSKWAVLGVSNRTIDLKKQSSVGGKPKKVDEEERFKCFMEVEGEQKFAQYAFWCFPITAHFGKNFMVKFYFWSFLPPSAVSGTKSKSNRFPDLIPQNAGLCFRGGTSAFG